MKKNFKVLLAILAVITVLLIYFLYRHPKKKVLSNVSWVKVTLPYRFKSHKAEELSISAFNLRKDGYYDQAIKLYHKAIEIEHDNPKLYFDLAECYERNNELQKAVMAMNSAIILDSCYPGFYSNRGNYHYQLFEDEEAIIDLEKAVQLNSTNPAYYYNLSIAYYSAKQSDKACEAFNQAKNLGLNTDEVKNQKEFIKLEQLCK